MAVTVEYLGHVEDAGTDAQSNFSFGSFGSEDGGRYLVALITTRDALDFTATTVTIGGVAAAITCQSAAVTNNTFAMIAIAAVPTGSSGTVVVDWSEAIARRQQCYLYKVVGITGTTAEDSKTKEGAGNPTLGETLAVSNGAAVFGVTISGDPAPTISWTGVTEDAENIEGSGGNNVSSAGHFVTTAASGAYTVQASFSPTPSGGQSIAVAAFAPVTAFTLTAAAGSFALTGQAAGLTRGLRLTAGVGAFALTGQAAGLLRQLLLAAAAGGFSLTGQATGLNRGFGFAAEPGALTLAGQDAALLRQLLLAAGTGAFTLTGQGAGLAKTILLVAGAAAFVLTGQDATLTYTRLLYPARVAAVPVVHLLEATPFDESVSDSLSAVPAPFGQVAFGGLTTFSVTTGGGEQLYLADGWFNSTPSDSPANQHYSPVLTGPFNFEVRLFEGLEPTGRATVGFGEIVIWNGDGALDALLDMGWSGRTVTLKRGSEFAALSTYATVFKGTTDGLTPDEVVIRLRLRDRQELLNRPLQSDLYQGTGGVEGDANLTGKRKPLAFGRLFNVPAVLIDANNLVFQLHDGPVAEILEVRDKGVPLDQDSSYADYATYAALVAATVNDGSYATCLALGLFRVGGQPAGQITADVWGEDSGGSNGYVETAASIIRRIVTTRLDTANLVDPTDLDTASFAAADSAQPAPIGYWAGPDSTLTIGQALDEIMASIGGWWTFTLAGLMSIGILTAPTGTADVVLTRADILLSQDFTLEGGQPSYRRRVGWQRNWAPQDPGALASGFELDAAGRLLYGEPYSIATPAADNAVLTKYGQAARDVLTAGLFAIETDAEAEGARLLALHKADRRLVRVGVRPADPFAAPLGGVVEISEFNRLTLSSSKKFRLIGIAVDIAASSTDWILWG